MATMTKPTIIHQLHQLHQPHPTIIPSTIIPSTSTPSTPSTPAPNIIKHPKASQTPSLRHPAPRRRCPVVRPSRCSAPIDSRALSQGNCRSLACRWPWLSGLSGSGNGGVGCSNQRRLSVRFKKGGIKEISVPGLEVVFGWTYEVLLKFHHFREGLWAFPKRPKWLLNRILVGLMAKFRATHQTVDWTKEGTIARYLFYNSGGKSHLSHCGRLNDGLINRSRDPHPSQGFLHHLWQGRFQISFKDPSERILRSCSFRVQIRDRSFVSSYEFDSQWPDPNRSYHATGLQNPLKTNGIQWENLWDP